MKLILNVFTKLSAMIFLTGILNGPAMATDPCDDFGECKVLIEINASDEDVGFYFLIDGDYLNSAGIYELPAAPINLEFDGSVITWENGDDLGYCPDFEELESLVMEGVLTVHPMLVVVDAWEIMFGPDVEDGNPLDKLKFTIRVNDDLIATRLIPVPQECLDALRAGTPVKTEVGAIGSTPETQ